MKTSLIVTATAIIFSAAVVLAQEEPVKPAQTPAPEEAAVNATQPQAQPAQPPRHKDEPTVTKGDFQEVQGEVSFLSSNSISVITSRNDEKGEETEMVFRFKKINVEHKKSLAEIGVGDYVLVRYQEETKDFGDRQESLLKPVTIRFVKPADDKSRYNKRSSTAGAGSASDSMPLKGVR